MKLFKITKQLILLLLLQACIAEQNMHNYDVYHQDRELSNLSVETGELESGYKKLLQISVFHTVKGGKEWRSSLEYDLFYKKMVISDLIIEDAGIDGFIQAYPKEGEFHPRHLFLQDIEQPLEFNNYAGFCSFSSDSRGGVDCSLKMYIEERHIKISFDKSQIEQFKDFKKMTKEIVLDYLPKHAEKF